MKKKINKSFADRAREITKRHPRAKYDKIEKENLERELDKLIQEQEEFKNSMNLNVPNTQPKVFETAGSFEGEEPTRTSTSTGETFPVRRIAPLEATVISQNLETDKLLNRLKPTVTKKSSLLPTYIGAGASVLGNLLQMALDKKPKKVELGSYKPQELDLYETRIAAKREADLARILNRNMARNLGLNAGQTINQASIADAEIQRNLGKQLLESVLSEKQYNTKAWNDAALVNTRLKGQEDMINQSLTQDAKQRQLEYLAGAVDIVPNLMAELNTAKESDRRYSAMKSNQDALLQLLLSGYKDYVPIYDANGNIVNYKYVGKW